MFIIMPSVRMPADHTLAGCFTSSGKALDEDSKRNVESLLAVLWVFYALSLLVVMEIEEILGVVCILGLTDFALRFWRIKTSLLFVPLCLWSFVICMFPIVHRILDKLGM